MPVLTTEGEALGIWIVHHPKHEPRVYTDEAEANKYNQAMDYAISVVSDEED
jgi:hypothetical protein